MAVLYAYGYKPKPSRTEADIRLADLSDASHGPDLFDIVRNVLMGNGQPYEVPAPPPPSQEDMRSSHLEFTPGDITADAQNRLIYGRVWMHRKGEAERKTKVQTGVSTQYADDDLGDRPLFFLISLPRHANEALVIVEAARPYSMVGFWRKEIRNSLNAAIPGGVYPTINSRGRAVEKDVILQWGAYGALDTPEFIERFSDGTVSEAAATRSAPSPDGNGDGDDEHRMIQVARSKEVDKRLLAGLIRRGEKKDVAELLIPVGMVDALGGEPDEVKFRGKFQGRDRLIVMTRSTVSQPGLEVPRTAPRNGYYVEEDALKDLASELAETVGHGHTWQ